MAQRIGFGHHCLRLFARYLFKEIAMRLLVAAFGVLAVLGMSAPTAFAGTPEDNCGAVFIKQSEKGVEAGGGPKSEFSGEGTLASPTNCDHFFQENGTIGNGTPPGQQP
jgi:hypothetical protein